jgi:citrate lyase beta subunit
MKIKTQLTPASIAKSRAALKRANVAFNKQYPGPSMQRQPVHTVYGGAQLFKSDGAAKLGAVALRALQENAPDAQSFAQVLGITERDGFGGRVYARVLEKLTREPVEDFRIDFEDGYGNRPDAEEDGHAVSAAEEVAKGLQAGTLPPFIGIRIKPFSEELFARSSRTLDLFVSTLAQRTKGKVPQPFFITLPKVTAPEQVAVLADILNVLERKSKIKSGSLSIELMVETPQSIFDRNGEVALPAMVAAARGRCTGAHFGTYDYTASVNITAAFQTMVHPACDFARHVMQVALSGTPIMLSDGATNVMPVGPHRAPAGGALTEQQRTENRTVVHRAWKLGYDHVRHSLEHAYYQGWDLHPAQLPIRYAAVYAFFLEGLEAASHRLSTFVDKAAQATLVGDVFDDAATGQGLLNFFLRGIACGAISEDEARATGLTIEEIRSRSFLKILEGRKKR